MKTLDEAIEVLKAPDDAEQLDMAVENLMGFSRDVHESEKVRIIINHVAAAYEESYFEPAPGITDVLVALALSSFAAGLRVGVEMERQSDHVPAKP